MFLKLLRVIDSKRLVREVLFHKGLNLVVDTTSGEPTDSGNDVGKTTFLRVIDYCLGGDGSNIYTDHEFKDLHNEAVYKYLHEGGVLFQLEMENEFQTIKIERGFEKTPKLNGIELGLAEFRERLGHELFLLNGTKPSLRQLLRKFIRIDVHQISNTVKYLHPNTSHNEYEPIYLFFFGFRDYDLISERNVVIKRIRALGKQAAGLKGFSRSSLRQILLVLERQIAEAEKQRDSFQLGPALAKETHRLEELRAQISDLSLQLANLAMTIRLNKDTIEKLERASSDIDLGMVGELYRQAQIVIPTLQTKFEEVVSFHNKMIGSKVRFVRSGLQRLEAEEKGWKDQLSKALAREQEILASLSKVGALVDLQRIQRELQDLHEEKGRRESILEEVERVARESDEAKSKAEELSDAIATYRSDLDKKISEFNVIFSDYSKRLYGEEYIFALDFLEDSKNLLDMRVENVRGNEGTGKKRAQVAVFDLSYLEFLARQNARTVRFTLHDRLEDISINQLNTLFGIADAIDGQFVVAVLKDKINTLDQEFIEKHTILTLSQHEKFFKLA